MSFREINLEIMLKGTILATIEFLFSKEIPTVNQFSKENAIAASTFRRAAQWLLGLLPGLLESRRPGPQAADETSTSGRQEALKKLEALKLWLVENRSPTEKNNCFRGEAKQRIAHLSEEIQTTGIMSFKEIAERLGMDERQLLRIRQEIKDAGGGAPAPASRRPRQCQKLAEEIQQLIGDIEASGNSRNPRCATDIKRILEANYKDCLKAFHDSETIALDTVSKYMKKAEEKPQRDHPRGDFQYPQPFQQVAIDTMHIKFFGMTFYLITVFELAGRLNLLTRVFLKENTEAVVSVIEESLVKFSSVEAAIIDRGTPYLNEEVKKLFEKHGKLRIVAPPAAPTAKAACERHFLTLREVIEPALASVFAADPGWEREKLAKALELSVTVFQSLYHQIPQEGIDGKSPAERIRDFDPVKACAARLALFKRSLDSEPVEEFALELHQRFQFPGSVEETVSRLRKFGTRLLRRAAEKVAPYMKPPFPKWMKDPVGLLAAKTRSIQKIDTQEYLEKAWRQEEEKRQRELAAKKQTKLQEEAREREENPERFLDSTLKNLVTFSESKFQGGVNFMAKKLKELLRAFSGKLGAAFESEVSRLKARIRQFSESVTVQEMVSEMIDGLVKEISLEKGFT